MGVNLGCVVTLYFILLQVRVIEFLLSLCRLFFCCRHAGEGRHLSIQEEGNHDL